jgi:hypothetical protein
LALPASQAGATVGDMEEIQRYADAIMVMIKEDQAIGQVPGDVFCWDELDDSVDTEDYFRQARLPSAAGLRDAVTAELDRRLSGSHGGPWHVLWTRPGGAGPGEANVDVGRTVGYATRAQAEAVGREYLAEHGGAFYVDGGG